MALAASVFYQICSKNDVDYFLWLIVAFQHTAHNLQKSFIINHCISGQLSLLPSVGQ